MPISRRKNCSDNDGSTFRLWQLPALLLVILASEVAIAGDALWVEYPRDVAFSIGNLTSSAREMGLTDAAFATVLSTSLDNAGLTAHRSDSMHDDVLFLDIIVEDESFYTSIGFWRMVSFRLPNGEVNSELVNVWQDYSFGVHHDDPDRVRDTVNSVINRFIASYGAANDVSVSLQLAARP